MLTVTPPYAAPSLLEHVLRYDHVLVTRLADFIHLPQRLLGRGDSESKA